MEKFILDEAFELAYQEVLNVSIEEELRSLREDYEQETQNFIDSLNILTESPIPAEPHIVYDKLSRFKDKDDDEEPEDDDDPEEDQNERNRRRSEPRQKKNGGNGLSYKDILDLYDKMNERSAQKIEKLEDDLNKLKKEKRINPSYSAQPQYVEMKELKNLPFPQNIVFFITQLITWIKRNILNFIDKFSNIVRSLLGLRVSEPKFNKDDLTLKMSAAKTIETKYGVITDGNTYNLKYDTSDDLNRINGYKVLPRYEVNAKPAKIININPSDVKLLTDDWKLLDSPVINEAEQDVRILTIDTSKDLYNLKLSLQHFFDLFDNAFGSNDEKLFSVDDLEIILELLKKSVKTATDGMPTMEVSGALTTNTIDANKIKDNLIRTKINTDNLKKAYVITNQQINAIAKIIMNKNIIGISQMGVQYAFLSSSSYKELSEMLEIVDIRLDEAKNIEKKLIKMKASYETLTKELEKKRSGLAAVKAFNITTIAQRQIENLYDASRYMTQVVQLRLNALSLYISEINDTRSIIKNMNAIGEANKKLSFGDKLKNIFKK